MHWLVPINSILQISKWKNKKWEAPQSKFTERGSGHKTHSLTWVQRNQSHWGEDFGIPASCPSRSNTNPALHNNPFSSREDAQAALRPLFYLSLQAKAIRNRNMTIQASFLLLKRQFYPSCPKCRVIPGGINTGRSGHVSTSAASWAHANSQLGTNTGDTGKGDPNQAVPKTWWPPSSRTQVLTHPVCPHTKAFPSAFFWPLI